MASPSSAEDSPRSLPCASNTKTFASRLSTMTKGLLRLSPESTTQWATCRASLEALACPKLARFELFPATVDCVCVTVGRELPSPASAENANPEPGKCAASCDAYAWVQINPVASKPRKISRSMSASIFSGFLITALLIAFRFGLAYWRLVFLGRRFDRHRYRHHDQWCWWRYNDQDRRRHRRWRNHCENISGRNEGMRC